LELELDLGMEFVRQPAQKLARGGLRALGEYRKKVETRLARACFDAGQVRDRGHPLGQLALSQTRGDAGGLDPCPERPWVHGLNQLGQFVLHSAIFADRVGLW
jgi:hypothetical protein